MREKLEFIRSQLLTSHSAVLVVCSYCWKRKSDNYFHSKRHDNSALPSSYSLPVDDVVFVPFRAFASLVGGVDENIKTTREDNSSESEEMKDKFCLFIFLQTPPPPFGDVGAVVRARLCSTGFYLQFEN